MSNKLFKLGSKAGLEPKRSVQAVPYILSEHVKVLRHKVYNDGKQCCIFSLMSSPVSSHDHKNVLTLHRTSNMSLWFCTFEQKRVFGDECRGGWWTHSEVWRQRTERWTGVYAQRDTQPSTVRVPRTFKCALSLYICFCHFLFNQFSDVCQVAGKSAAKVYQRNFRTCC